MSRCDDCGFVYEQLAAEEISHALLSVASRIGELLASRDADTLRTRPAPETWSAVEYACHLRDVFLVQRDRVILALVEERPSFPAMYRDARPELVGYRSERPADVAEEMALAARMLALLFSRLSAGQLARRCFYNYPQPTEVDLTWVGQHTVHEGRHHIGDIEQVLATL